MRKGEKNFVPNSVPTRPWLENWKKKLQKNSKNLKTSFRHYFYPNRDEIGQEREKIILVPNSFLPEPGQKIPKIIAKIFKKLKNITPALFLSKPRWDRSRKREKSFSPEFRSYPTLARKFPKKIAKKFKKLKNIISVVFLSKPG